MSEILGKYKYHFLIFALLAVMVTIVGIRVGFMPAKECPIIPKPNSISGNHEQISCKGISKIIASEELAQGINQQCSDLLSNYISGDSTDGIDLYLSKDESFTHEQYKLDINEQGIFISANKGAGYFYALQSLKQLLSINKNYLPSISIKDNPRFKWRGLHLDVSRHFYGVDKIKEILDWMAFYKMNRFHWHLVDDQGWRIEIKKYPELTSIGSVRTETDGSTYGPFYYTHEQIIDVVQYASDRHIEVIPEIELPGHSTSALAAYPKLGCQEKNIEVGNTWGVYDDVFCAGKEETFSFLEDVLTEVMGMFPCQYIHIGADECPKSRWIECSKCQRRIQDNQLKDEYELQAYFVERIADFLKEHNKKLIGWDEILQGYLAKDAVVMSWHGIECGEIAVRGGNPAIMTPREEMYFDKYQGDSEAEPLAIGGYIPLKTVYDCEPMPERLSKAEEQLVLGVQANLWTEHIHTEAHLDYMLMPRMQALAEVAWTNGDKKNWKGFQQRLLQHYPILDKQGVNYHIALPEGVSNTEVITSNEKLCFKVSDPNVNMYLKQNGKPAEIFNGKYKATQSEVIEVYSQLPGGKKSTSRKINIRKMAPLKVVNPEGVKGPGLRCRWTKAEMKTETEVMDYQWQNSIKVKDPSKARDCLHSGEKGVITLSGYVKVPKTGVYEFEGHPDWLRIDQQLVMDNSQNSKRIMYRGQIALQKGWHRIQAVYLIRDFLSMPDSKIKTDLRWRMKSREWENIKYNCYDAN